MLELNEFKLPVEVSTVDNLLLTDELKLYKLAVADSTEFNLPFALLVNVFNDPVVESIVLSLSKVKFSKESQVDSLESDSKEDDEEEEDIDEGVHTDDEKESHQDLWDISQDRKDSLVMQVALNMLFRGAGSVEDIKELIMNNNHLSDESKLYILKGAKDSSENQGM